MAASTLQLKYVPNLQIALSITYTIQIYQYLHSALKLSLSLHGVRCKILVYKEHLLNNLQVFTEEFQVDRRLDHLMRVMVEVMVLITAGSTRLLLRLIQQAIECFIFIRKYSQRSFEGELDFLATETCIDFL